MVILVSLVIQKYDMVVHFHSVHTFFPINFWMLSGGQRTHITYIYHLKGGTFCFPPAFLFLKKFWKSKKTILKYKKGSQKNRGTMEFFVGLFIYLHFSSIYDAEKVPLCIGWLDKGFTLAQYKP